MYDLLFLLHAPCLRIIWPISEKIFFEIVTISGGGKFAAPSPILILTVLLNAVQATFFDILLYVDDAGVDSGCVLI